MSSLKYKIFKGIHDYPVEIWIMWLVMSIFILLIVYQIYYGLTDESELYQSIMKM